MLLNKKISLIIPCKNEEAALYSLLKKIPPYIDEVLVVDNGSVDNTISIAKLFGAQVITEKKSVNGIGYGFAHQQGMKEATGDILVAMDGDDTYPPEAISEIITYMDRSGIDFVSCARFPLTDPHAISQIRQWGVKFLNALVSLLYGYQIKDILSGMWIMKKKCAKYINVKNGEWNFSPGIKLAAINSPKIRFSEFHINHTLRMNGSSKQNLIKTGFSHTLYIIRRRLTVDKISHRDQVRFIFTQVRYAFKLLLTVILLKPKS